MENEKSLTITEEDLAKKIAEEVAKAVAEKESELKKSHDSEMAQFRINAKAEKEVAVKKAKEEANLSAEELAKKQVEEQTKLKDQELAELRAYKKRGELTQKLANASVPTMFVNDSRLLSAEDGDIDAVIETIKKEYQSTLPKGGAVVDTNVKGNATSGTDPEKAELERVRKLGLR